MRANDFTADELVDLLGRVVAALHDQRVSPMSPELAVLVRVREEWIMQYGG